LRDALWSRQNSAPDQARVLAVLCAYIVIAQRLARAPWFGFAGMVKFSDGGLVLVFGAAVAGAILVPTVTLEGGGYRITLVCPF
jgi:hypothetical protein